MPTPRLIKAVIKKGIAFIAEFTKRFFPMFPNKLI
jgi:hypothetical protein